MRMITRESDYGIAALVSLAGRRGAKASAAELAKELRIPGAFLRRILQRLGRSGIIRSTKGVGGGFELAMKPENILVSDIVTALQGPISISDCDLRAGICAMRGRCMLRRKLKAMEKRLSSELMSISIASLAN
jgi:Rrf2 family protein